MINNDKALFRGNNNGTLMQTVYGVSSILNLLSRVSFTQKLC